MNHFDKLIIRISCQFTFNTMLYLRYSLELLKCQFCISNALVHLFFCNRSPNSNKGNCRSCSRLFVNNVNDFVSWVKYHFTYIFPSNDIFDKDIELLFTKANLMNFTLDVLYWSGTHYVLVDSKQNRCLYFLVAKQPYELAVKLSELG